MNRIFRAGAILALVSTTMPAIAAPKLAVYPVQTGLETARFKQGVPTLDLETPTGAIQVTPLGFDHGGLTFAVGVYNKGTTTANFGVENIAVTAGTESVTVMTKDQLASKAKSRAMWTAIAIGVLAAGAAVAVANASTTNTYRSSTYTPWGNIHRVASYTDNSIGTLGAAAAVGGGVAGIVGIQNRLDYTLANLADEIVQTTTVEPDASYGGRVVFAKLKSKTLPQDVRISLNFSGVSYPFTFRITKPGQNLPTPFTAPPAVPVSATVVAAPSPVTPTAVTKASLVVIK